MTPSGVYFFFNNGVDNQAFNKGGLVFFKDIIYLFLERGEGR